MKSFLGGRKLFMHLAALCGNSIDDRLLLARLAQQVVHPLLERSELRHGGVAFVAEKAEQQIQPNDSRTRYYQRESWHLDQQASDDDQQTGTEDDNLWLSHRTFEPDRLHGFSALLGLQNPAQVRRDELHFTPLRRFPN